MPIRGKAALVGRMAQRRADHGAERAAHRESSHAAKQLTPGNHAVM